MNTNPKWEIKKNVLADVDIVLAAQSNAKRISTIEKVGKMASLSDVEAGISPLSVLQHMVQEAGGSFYMLRQAWESKIGKSDKTQQVMVAQPKSKGVVQGVAHAKTHESEKWLSSLYVAKAVQGLGVASKLFDAVVEFHEGQPFGLVVASFNQPAIDFYKHKGMQKVDETDCAYTIGGVAVPQIKMVYQGD